VRAREAGFTVKTGSELEFYLFDETYETAADKRYHDLKTTGRYVEDYHILQTTKEEGFVRSVRNGMEGAGIPVEFSKGEWGPGQQEINLRYAEALEMADRHAIYKNGVKEIAWQHDKAVTFMAKWREDLAGNSYHLHMSLWDAATDAPESADEVAPEGLSSTMRHWLAGQLALAREMTLFLAPYVNSYKRFQAASFAPTKAVWGRDNRTVGFRVVGAGPSMRVECRIPGADANPYLATAAMVAAGLHGVVLGRALDAATGGDAYGKKRLPDVPKTLREAIRLLDRSKVLRTAIGDEVIEHYLHAARWEQSEYDRRITDFELKRYFERS
ncbi:MAG: glutamine synthetase family protein, partial [Alphaproteobacteria bacterium]|nr:glutamine synthetase family protein [Alphaproteobacteria bacterium]